MLHQFGSLFDQQVGSPTHRGSDVAGTANTSRPWSSASFAVIAEPLYCAPSTTSKPALMPLIIRLRMGKFCGKAAEPMGNSEMISPFETSSAASPRLSEG